MNKELIKIAVDNTIAGQVVAAAFYNELEKLSTPKSTIGSKVYKYLIGPRGSLTRSEMLNNIAGTGVMGVAGGVLGGLSAAKKKDSTVGSIANRALGGVVLGTLADMPLTMLHSRAHRILMKRYG